jgi:hypothetical protein
MFTLKRRTDYIMREGIYTNAFSKNNKDHYTGDVDNTQNGEVGSITIHINDLFDTYKTSCPYNI